MQRRVLCAVGSSHSRPVQVFGRFTSAVQKFIPRLNAAHRSLAGISDPNPMALKARLMPSQTHDAAVVLDSALRHPAQLCGKEEKCLLKCEQKTQQVA
jgi:hypothetical protein